MKILQRILLIAVLGCAGCRMVRYDVFEHPETRRYQRQFEIKLPKDVFEKHPDLVDAGIFFMPRTRELAWPSSRMAIVHLYAKRQNDIIVKRVTLSSPNLKEVATVRVEKRVRISNPSNNTGLLHSSVLTEFKRINYVEAILSNERVTLSIYYQLPDVRGEKRLDFDLRKKEITDIAWST